MNNPDSIESLLKWATAHLNDSESPALDARLLLCHCLECNQAYLLTWPDKVIDTTLTDQYRKLIEQRAEGHPVAHLLGYRDFWTLRLRTNPSTLIPRPETELLVEQALVFELPHKARVLDLGTGTGAIALALASEKPDWQVTGVDFQSEAVELAKTNGSENSLSHVRFEQSDWFSALNGESFDLIVSNPPYVEDDSKYLNQGDVRFEPLSALTSGTDGLNDIRRICRSLAPFLNANGWVLFEHGNTQAEAVQQILRESGLSKIASRKDLNQQPRITFAHKSH